jgi:hypothetical protein
MRRIHGGMQAGALALGLVGLSGLFGCYTTPLTTRGMEAPTTYDVTRYPGAWGQTGIGEKVECPQGMHSVLISEPWYSNLLRLVTLGMVATYRVHVVCSQPASAS